MPIDVDVGQLPFFFSRWDGVHTVDELDAFIGQLRAVHRRKQPYASIAFMKDYSSGRTPEIRARMTSWLKESEPALRDYCLGSGIISRSTGFRFVLSWVFLIKSLPCPHQVCGNFDDTVTFLQQEAKKRGLTLPSPQRPWSDLP
jgi:hypothetical protein